MIRPHASRIGPIAALGLVVLLVGVAGCYNPFSPRLAPVLGHSQPAPVPNSPTNLLRLFEWCYNNRAIAEYRELFTDDYRFFFDPADSTGKEYSGTPWTREDELISTTHFFVGGSATEQPASSISMRLDQNFFVFPDPNYTKWDPLGRWHKSIRTQILFTFQTGSGNSQEVSGAAHFYLVRGDSAIIPEELKLLGFGPNPNRWYIRRLDDETAHPEISSGSAARTLPMDVALPAGPTAARRWAASGFGDPPIRVAWGFVKAQYRGPRVAPDGATRPATGTR